MSLMFQHWISHGSLILLVWRLVDRALLSWPWLQAPLQLGTMGSVWVGFLMFNVWSIVNIQATHPSNSRLPPCVWAPSDMRGTRACHDPPTTNLPQRHKPPRRQNAAPRLTLGYNVSLLLHPMSC
ncbi:hypothetical protein EV126DRAFT_100983 [Verticillium dahliae]|nr:hypothetical protein EV126DRAFT_100983 [Verticillium dahliae]